MSDGEPDEDVVYELTLTGGLGAVFRTAIRPHDVTRSQVCTIIRARVPPGGDLVDLVRLLAQHGLILEDVFPVES